MCIYNHRTCAALLAQKCKTGVGIIPYSYYSEKDLVFMLGKERGGKYQNKYNICSGKRNHGEDCWIETALRELKEEFKLDWSFHDFELAFRSPKTGKIRYLIHNQTPVFIGLKMKLSRNICNALIRNEKSTTSSHHEISSVEFFRVTWNGQIYLYKTDLHKTAEISSFASAVLPKAIQLVD